MIDRETIYSLIYALAATDGREKALFGTCAPLAQEAFRRSLVGDGFPELWFELPLLGEPWFDLHALASREELSPETTFSPETTGGYPEVFSWFARQDGVRQLALSYDVSSGNIDTPAIQLLIKDDDGVNTSAAFLEQIGRADAVPAYRAFCERLPKGWYACYTGSFPGRERQPIHVECIPQREQQMAYARNAMLLAADLRRAGLALHGSTILPRCRALMRAPYAAEFQFEIMPDGSAGPTFSVSSRTDTFSVQPGSNPFLEDGPIGDLMEQIVSWGLADERWRLLMSGAFAKRISHGDNSVRVFCMPAFIKLKWRDGEPVDAKAYLRAGIR